MMENPANTPHLPPEMHEEIMDRIKLPQDLHAVTNCSQYLNDLMEYKKCSRLFDLVRSEKIKTTNDIIVVVICKMDLN